VCHYPDSLIKQVYSQIKESHCTFRTTGTGYLHRQQLKFQTLNVGTAQRLRTRWKTGIFSNPTRNLRAPQPTIGRTATYRYSAGHRASKQRALRISHGGPSWHESPQQHCSRYNILDRIDSADQRSRLKQYRQESFLLRGENMDIGGPNYAWRPRHTRHSDKRCYTWRPEIKGCTSRH